MALRAEERIVAGGRDDLLVVHHLSLRGSNRAIGRYLGEIARGRYGAAPAAGDPSRARVHHEWMRRHDPIAFERARGLAEAFGVDGADEGREPCALAPASTWAGCGIAWLPPRSTARSRPLLSRTFDAALAPPRQGVPPIGCPYLLELHPDEGHASLAMVTLDFLGAVEGVNAQGLAVAMAVDEEARADRAFQPAAAPAAGLDELHVVRYLLDGCATAAEARDALRTTQRCFTAAPAHYVVADRRGDAFAFEPGPSPSQACIVEAEGRPLVLTNHPLRRYPSDRGLPGEDGPAGTYARYRRLRSALAELAAPYRREDVRALGARGFEEGPPAGALRTLWHAVYDLGEGALEVSFLLRDGPGAARPGTRETGRTAYLPFRLAA